MRGKGIVLFLAWAAAWAAAAGALLRFTAAPLSRSVRNEGDAAIDRACAWLASRQDADGSWGGDAKATAATLLALAGSGEELPPAERATIDRGVAWLAANAAATTNSPLASAWRGIALAIFGQDARQEAEGITELMKVAEAMAPFGKGGEAERDFWTVHAVNRAPEGEAPDDGASDGWRAWQANRWTTTQQIDARGRGHWGDSVEETAFAVLLLKEL